LNGWNRMVEDPVSEATKDLRAWMAVVQAGHAPASQDKILDSAAHKGVEVLVLRSDLVFGLDHLRSALFHAKKAMKEHRNASESLAMETLLYASGERQLSSAIKKMAVDSSSSEMVIVQLTEGGMEEARAWQPLPSTRSDMLTRDALLKFGMTGSELTTVDDRRVMDLVLEKVASVDILKK
jgi:tRNA threonylcarbamoyladenosine modification (KEOPS) complex Cgi121 subunit